MLPLLLAAAVCACRHDPEAVEAKQVAGLLGLRSGATVADIGAGNGHFTAALAGEVGGRVKVVATELGRPAVTLLWNGLRREGAGGVSVVEGLAYDTNLPAESCDAIVLRRTYHHFAQPADMAASLFRTLRPGGRLVVIEQPLTPIRRVPRNVSASRGGDGIDPPVLVAELTAAGFHHDLTMNPLPNRLYLVVMRKR